MEENKGKPAGGEIDSTKVGDEELIRFLADEGRILRSRLERISQSTFEKYSPTILNSSEAPELINSDLVTPIHVAEKSVLPGIAVNVLRKNASHHDFNTGEIFTPWGSREFGYSDGNSVGDLFRKGKNIAVAVRVNRPFWVGIGTMTYHSRVELFCDPRHWRPGGVVWWGEVFGWYGPGLGGTLHEWTFNWTIN
jgi:hypothetical protein